MNKPTQVVAFLALLALCLTYTLDSHNYFYLNSSYVRDTISFTVCFKLDQNATVKFESRVLVPHGDYTTTGTMDNEKNMIFDNQYDGELVGFNNYDKGEYWFGIKIPHYNTRKDHFLPLGMELTIGGNARSYQFLVPLFRFPLSAIEVAPQNSLRVCHGEYLVSSRFAEGEFDVSVFSAMDAVNFGIKEEKSWGFFQSQQAGKYLRFKSNKAEQLSLLCHSIGASCRIDKTFSASKLKAKAGYNIQQLIQSSQALDRNDEEEL